MLGNIGLIVCTRGGCGPFAHFTVALLTRRIGIGTHFMYRFLWSCINLGVGGEELVDMSALRFLQVQ